MTLEDVIINARYQMADDGVLDANTVCDRVYATKVGGLTYSSYSRHDWDDEAKYLNRITSDFIQRFSVLKYKVPVYYRHNAIATYSGDVSNVILTIVASNGKKYKYYSYVLWTKFSGFINTDDLVSRNALKRYKCATPEYIKGELDIIWA